MSALDRPIDDLPAALEDLFAGPPPSLRTERFVLRPFTVADAPDVQRLAGEREIAATTLAIPHPYPDGFAETWISDHAESWKERREIRFAITDASSEKSTAGELLGASVLKLQLEHHEAEVGYWVGKPHWGRGIASEVAAELVRYAFEEMGLHRVHAFCLTNNPASGRVLEKAGLRYEGTNREAICKWGEFFDVAMYGLLRSDFDSESRAGS